MSPLWMSIEPSIPETRLMLTQPGVGTALRARLAPLPAQSRALCMLLEAIVAWYGQPLCAVLDAEAEDVGRHPDRWAKLLGDADSAQIQVEWCGYQQDPRRRERFFGPGGEFRRAGRLVNFSATGQP